MFNEWTHRLKQASAVLPDVYGEPPGTKTDKRAVRRAKELLRSGAGPEWAIRKAAKENKVSIKQLTESLLSMRGAEPEEVAS